MKYGVFVLAVLLVACGSAADEVQGEGTFLEEQVAKLKAALADKDALVAQKDALVADAKALVASLEAEISAKQTLVDQQKTILKDMDNERLDALAEAERCTELEKNNEQLQKMIDICQEDLR